MDLLLTWLSTYQKLLKKLYYKLFFLVFNSFVKIENINILKYK